MMDFLSTLAQHTSDWVPRLLPALVQTLLLTFTSFLGALLIAFVIEYLRNRKSRLCRAAAVGYIDIFRSVPILAVLYLLYFGLPGAGIVMSAFVAGTLGLALVYGAFLAEVVRAGIDSVNRGQKEAALAVGLTPFTAFMSVVLPQALRAVTPPLLVSLISLLKDTSICSLIAVNELTLESKLIVSQSFLPLHIFVLVGVIYFLISWPMSLATAALERRLSRGRGSARVEPIPKEAMA
jgi:polar amino acid transport system permease protein